MTCDGDKIQDIPSIWGAINALRKDMSQILVELQSMAAVLAERCESRAAYQIALEKRIGVLEDKYHLLDKTILRVSLVTGAVSALLASAGTALIVRAIAAWGG